MLNDDVRVMAVVGQPDANGVYLAIVEVKAPDGTWQTKTVGATNKPVNNTMFPKDWDAARVQAEIESAWNAADKTIQGTRWSGTSSSGVTIEGYTHPRATAFPIYSKPIK